MKQKLVIIAAVLTLALFAAPDASAQWEHTTVPQGVGGRCFASIGTKLIAGTEFGIYSSTDSGASWIPSNTGLPIDGHYITEVNALAASGTYLAAGTLNNGVYLSTDSGASWSPANTGMTTTDIPALVFEDTTLFAGSFQSGVTISTNMGTSWAPSDSGLDANVVSFITTITGIFAGTGSNEGFGGVYMSTDTGRSWTLTSTGALTGSYVTSFAVKNSYLFAGTFNGDYVFGGNVFLSTDNGASWANESNGLPSISSINTLAVSGMNLFAGIYYDGVYLSTNDGTSWQNVNTFSGDWDLRSLYVFGGILFAGSDSGVWYRPLSEMIGSSSVAQNPSAQSSIAAYPNPFTQTTTLNFTTPESGTAEVTIVNALGEEVSRIFDGEMNAGEHSFTWDANGMAPGTYWCIVRIGGQTNRVPIILVK